MREQGQSLIETIVAFSVISLGVVAVLSLAISSISLSGQSNQKIVSINLAREGIEVVRSIRDSNQLDPESSWPYGVSSGKYIVNFDSVVLTSADAQNLSDCDNCGISLTNNVYRHSVDPNLTYKRMIVVTPHAVYPSGAVDVESQVSWREHNRLHNFNLKTTLFDLR